MSQDKKLEIRIDNDTAHGVYANSFLVSSSANEFNIDFLYQNYQQTLLQSRVIITPQKAQELVQLLKQQLDKYAEEVEMAKAESTPVN